MKLKRFLRSVVALASCAAVTASYCALPTGAAVINKEKENNYDNFAEALQLALCFYDANKCGDEVAEDGYYSWRGNCHVKDGVIPLQPMNPMPELYGEEKNDGSENGQKQEEKEDKQPIGEGDGDGGLSAAEGLYEGVNMSQEFIEENREFLDPDGNGTLDLTGGWHDAGDHVKFGLPGSYSASTVGWGYYEFRQDYIDLGLQKHVEDELRWINDYFMKATFLDDKGEVVGYCYQVGEGNNDHNYWCAPELQVDGTVVASSSCAVKRPAYFATKEMPAPDQCAGASASLAINYLNFKDTDPEYAAESLKYAKALYEFAVATHEEVWTPGTTPSSSVLGYDGGFYHSSYDYDELAWAAVWLYYASVAEDETQKQAAYDKYIEDIISVDESITLSGDGGYDAQAQTGQQPSHPYTGYMKRIITDTGNSWQNIWVHCWDTVWGGVFAKLAPITNTARDWYIFRYNLEYWSGCSATEDCSKWGYEPLHSHKDFGPNDYLWNTPMTAEEVEALPDKDAGDFIKKSPYGWAVVSGYGSARYNTAAGLCACVYAKTTGDDVFLPWAKRQMEYILGDNPMGYAYEVGYEYSYASNPHHRSSHCSAKQAMDDPVNQVHTLWGALVGGPDLDDYHEDITKEYIYNEVTDDYNAAFCGDLAGLYHYYGAEGKELADKNHVIEDFDMSKNAYTGFEQIDADGAPLPTGLYVAGGKNQEQDNSIQLKIVVYNRTIDPPKFESNLKARYYFNISELTDEGYDSSYIEARIDYDQEKSYTNGENEAILSGPTKYDDKGTYYIEVSWQNCDFYGSRTYQVALVNKMDQEKYVFPKWDSSNDYSYSDLVSFEDDNEAAAITDKITLYADDKLVWGVEPDGTTPEETTGSTSGIVYGDANCDGFVSVADPTLIMQSIANPTDFTLDEKGKNNADVNERGDGVTSADALSIQKFLAGSLEELPETA